MLITLVAPTVEPVSLVEMKEHLRVAHTDQDALITSCVKAAREAVEARTGMALAAATYRWSPESELTTLTRLPLWPVATVTSVIRTDAYGAETTLTVTTDYLLDARRSRLRLVSEPLAGNNLSVDFTVVAPTHIPESLKQAIKLIAADTYEQARGVVEGISVNINPTLSWLIDPHRVNLGV